MNTASSFLQIAALTAVFAIQFGQAGEFRMPGVRRALQTIDVRGSVPAAPFQTGCQECPGL